jgi:hypothetical protein
MADLLFLVVTVAFFAVAAGFVSLCDRIIGPDADHGDPQGAGETDADEPHPGVDGAPARHAGADAELVRAGGVR